MPFNVFGLTLALITAGIIYLPPMLKMRSNGPPIPYTTRNVMNAALIVGGGYFIFTGLLGLIK